MFKKRRNKNLLISLVVLFVFAFLMIFGLKHNPNFTPSQLLNKSAPIFEAEVSDGSWFQFQNILSQKKWVVVNFWSSSCIVCREEADELEKFYKNYSFQVQFVSVNIEDSLESVQSWQKNYAQTFPVVLDKKGLISVSYGVTGTPETFLIDPEGKVRKRIAGSVDEKYLKHILKEVSFNQLVF
jgi:cytochrome c biogenesis protein CcmG/thiol:disulfide interchange protein DsbE